jgi:hypothetical protein
VATTSTVSTPSTLRTPATTSTTASTSPNARARDMPLPIRVILSLVDSAIGASLGPPRGVSAAHDALGGDGYVL